MTMTVNVRPLTEGERSIPERLRPQHPPIFPEGNPTPEEIELARELLAALDSESQRWYGNCAIFADE